jgi:ATP-binding cassette subfamily B protein
VAAGGAGADVLPGRAAGDPRRATATLDAKAEHELFARIGELFSDRSVLLISHRFSTVRSADRIYVLNEGFVVESGTHSELVAARGNVCGVVRAAASPYQ